MESLMVGLLLSECDLVVLVSDQWSNCFGPDTKCKRASLGCACVVCISFAKRTEAQAIDGLLRLTALSADLTATRSC